MGRLIGQARRRIKQAVGRRVSPHGLSPQQFWVLVNLYEGDEPSLSALCERLRMDPPTASRVVAVLARRRLLSPMADPKDRRRTRLRLTRQGRELAQRLRPLAVEVRAAVERDLTPAEALELRRLLRKVIASVERYDAGLEGVAV